MHYTFYHDLPTLQSSSITGQWSQSESQQTVTVHKIPHSLLDGPRLVCRALTLEALHFQRGDMILNRMWNVKWGVLPGMTWKHEHRVEELLHNNAISLARPRIGAT